MKKKSIHIIGGGVYGCLLAYQFSKNKSFEISLIESSSRLLSSLDKISLGNFNVNNGFHGIEIPRAKELFQFFNKKLNIKFKKYENIRKLLINRTIIDSQDKIKNWPDKIQGLFKKKKNENYKNQKVDFFFKKEMVDLIKLNSKRFSSNFKNSKNLFLPYFLPANINHVSLDEGDKFRNEVRKKKIKPYFALPVGLVFSKFQNPMKKFLKKRGVNIIFNTRANFKNNELNYTKGNKNLFELKNKGDSFFYCSSSALMLKDIDSKKIGKLSETKRFFYNHLVKIDEKIDNNFSELLSINKKIPFVNRITNLKYFNKNLYKKNFLQIELFLEDTKKILKINQKLILELKKIFNLKKNPIVVDYLHSRTTFLPDQNWINESTKQCKSWVKKNQKNLHSRYLFYPINLSKAWFYAEKDYKDYIKKNFNR
jgi:hypothetical protein